jgi:hypothetical protein
MVKVGVEVAWARASVVLLAVLVAASIAPLTSVRADVGVALDVGKITVDQRLAKGGTYELPVIGVRNPGSEAAAYQMGVSHVQGQAERAPPDGWFTFTPSAFSLEPGATQPVRITLDIPAGADPDDYAALIQAQIAPSGEGAQVGAAAAAHLTFTVEPSTMLEAWMVRGRRQLDRWFPWSYLLPALLLGTVTARWLGRRYRFGLRVERRP